MWLQSQQHTINLKGNNDFCTISQLYCFEYLYLTWWRRATGVVTAKRIPPINTHMTAIMFQVLYLFQKCFAISTSPCLAALQACRYNIIYMYGIDTIQIPVKENSLLNHSMLFSCTKHLLLIGALIAYTHFLLLLLVQWTYCLLLSSNLHSTTAMYTFFFFFLWDSCSKSTTFPAGMINFSVSKDAGTIRSREQIKGDFN